MSCEQCVFPKDNEHHDFGDTVVTHSFVTRSFDCATARILSLLKSLPFLQLKLYSTIIPGQSSYACSLFHVKLKRTEQT